MKHLLADVRAFHAACDVPVLSTPQIPSDDRVKLRTDLIYEEHKELLAAIEARDIEGVADALADLVYVTVGTALEFGIPLDRVWKAVQQSNMAKVDPETGFVNRRSDGKILKPVGWMPPDIARALTGDLFDEPDWKSGVAAKAFEGV